MNQRAKLLALKEVKSGKQHSMLDMFKRSSSTSDASDASSYKKPRHEDPESEPEQSDAPVVQPGHVLFVNAKLSLDTDSDDSDYLPESESYEDIPGQNP